MNIIPKKVGDSISVIGKGVWNLCVIFDKW